MICPPPQRFFCVHTEAIEQTHRALQQLEQQRRGSKRPSRALRVAQLYGYLQLRARDGDAVQLGLKHLAESWHVQPRELRADLNDLQSLGWLSFTSGMHGTTVQLSEPQKNEPLQSEQPALGTTEESMEPFNESSAGAPEASLIEQFCSIYNQERPITWPTLNAPNGALSRALQSAIAVAGTPDTFWRVLQLALQAMPEFWRTTYPQGRTGAQCAAALLKSNQFEADLGPEFWHVFRWGEAALQG
jgi:hypothetical protein